MMDEAPKLTQREALDVATQSIKRSGTNPVVVGLSAPGLAAIGELTTAVMDQGSSRCHGGGAVKPEDRQSDHLVLPERRFLQRGCAQLV
jgi:hypothetical protein